MTRLQMLGGLIILVLAIILGLSGFKLPPISNSVNTTNNANQVIITNADDLSTPNQTVNPELAFPGRLPDDRIQNRQARMVTNRGEIVVALNPAQAPLAVSNFIYLAESGFYDGIVWHRVENWVVQAGDPQTKDPSINPDRWGTGGPGYKFPDEPVSGEYQTGVMAMANAGPDTNGSQFFILKQDQALPPAYTIFGQVTDGLEAVQSLIQGDQIERIVIEPGP